MDINSSKKEIRGNEIYSPRLAYEHCRSLTFAASTENVAPTTQTAPSQPSSELFDLPRPPIPPGHDVKPQPNSDNNDISQIGLQV